MKFGALASFQHFETRDDRAAAANMSRFIILIDYDAIFLGDTFILPICHY